MKLNELYELVIKRGIETDPRGKEEVQKYLLRRKRAYEELSEKEKKEFDLESLKNPYADTRILYGEPDTEVGRILIGIDMEVGEVLLADRLRSRGQRIDLVISHHPEGKAYAKFYEVMHMQSDILHRFGVPINVAEDLLKERIREVEIRVMPVNHTRAVDAARLLDFPFMCIHTPSDNAVTDYLQMRFDREKPETLGDVTDLLKEIPEYQEGARNNAGPVILVGSKERRAGKVFVDMTGGTDGSKGAFEKLVQAGVGTIVVMHMSDDYRKEAEKNHLNVIIAGHIASDNLGINLLLDEVERLERIEVLPCSGFRRIERMG